MLLPLILPMLLLGSLFAYLPLGVTDRLFSIPVNPAWRSGADARSIRNWYLATIGVVTLACIAAAVVYAAHGGLVIALPFVQALLAAAACAWGWRRTMPHRTQETVIRSASLRPHTLARASIWITLASLLPLATGAIVLLLHYPTLPAAIAIHYNAHGVADHYLPRTPFAVLLPLLAGAVIVLLATGLLLAMQHRSAGVADGGRHLALSGIIAGGAVWFATLGCAAVSLVPLAANPAAAATRLVFNATAATMLFAVLTVVLLLRNRTTLASAQAATALEHWRGGIIYFNRQDTALFVPKRLGVGYTLNFARPTAWLLMTLIVAAGLLLKRI